jgi:hypothetical protein
VRYQYEWVNHNNWGEGPEDEDGYLLQRYMLHADWRLSPRLRLFGQLKSGIETGKAGGPDLPDEDLLDVHQAFAEVSARTQGVPVSLRLGRQEMAYGASRLVSVREAPNVRQTFDALRVTLAPRGWRIDGFGSRPAETRRGVFDDRTSSAVWFWGLYAVHAPPRPAGGNLDLYYFGYSEAGAAFAQGVARERRHTGGLRLWGQRAAWQYNLEGAGQLGSFGEGRIRAWTASADVTWSPGGWPLSPEINLKTEVISGDRRREHPDLQTFNPLYPKGAYFGQVALIGPANLKDLHPSITLHPRDDLLVATDWDFFWRASPGDGLYGVPYVLLREGRESRASYIGDQLTLELDWEATRHLQLEGFFTYFRAGPFLKETGAGRNLTYCSLRTTYKF